MVDMEHNLHGIMAEFDSATELVDAARQVRDAGYKKTDAFSPFPLHEIDEALAAHARRATFVRDHLATLSAAELTRPIEVLENGETTVQEGVYTVLEEAFWHIRYARRDLEQLASREVR